VVSQLIPSNVAQKLPGTAINRRDVASHPVTYYTCPAGQKARCTGTIQCTGRGAAATVDFIAAGIIMFRWVAGAFNGGYLDNPRLLVDSVDQFARFDFELIAGETVVSAQDSGTNAELNLFMNVIETPV